MEETNTNEVVKVLPETRNFRVSMMCKEGV